MQSNIENQLIAIGTPGNNYYIYLNDWKQSWLCSPAAQSVSFTPYYAAFIAERPNPSFYHLAKFNPFNFTQDTNDQSNLWLDYNNGYGFGVYMYNNGYQETTTYAMIHLSGSYYGNFKIGWVTSIGT
jgi:hypothetical protein